MPTQHDYPDLPLPVAADPVALVKELRKRRKSISEADLDALEQLLVSTGTHVPVTVKERYVAVAKAVPVTADLFTDAGQGQASMQQRIVEALRKVQ